MKRAGPHPHVVVEDQEGYQLQRFLLSSEGSQLHTRLPSLGHHCWEEEPLQHLVVKVSKDSIHSAAENLGILLKF